MTRIFKYPFEIDDYVTLFLPEGAEVLCVGDQQGVMNLWARVNPANAPTVARKFRVFGTGHPIPDNGLMKYLGTVQQMSGQLIWHMFEDIGH